MEADEIPVFNAGHVGALAQGFTKGALARAHGTNHESDLGKHSSAGIEPNFGFFLATIDFTDLLKLLVHFNNGS